MYILLLVGDFNENLSGVGIIHVVMWSKGKEE